MLFSEKKIDIFVATIGAFWINGNATVKLAQHCALQLREEIGNWSLCNIVRPFAAAASLLASLTLQKCGKIGDSGSSRGVGEHFAGIVPQAPGVHPGLLTGLSTHQGFRLTAPPTRGLRSWYMGQSSPHAVGLRPFYILCGLD